jgi:uncharacterized membrane protein
MTGDQDRDLTARLTELEATVRGLTQELVSAEERIRQLEAAVDETPAETDGGATKASPADGKAEPDAAPEDATDEADTEFDDIIVA